MATQLGLPIRDALGSALSLCCDSNVEFHADLTFHWDLSLSTRVKGTATPVASEAYSMLGNPPTHPLIPSGVAQATLRNVYITPIS